MKFPVRKAASLLKYCCLAAFILLVGYNVNQFNLKEGDGVGQPLGQGSMPEHRLTEEEVWAAAPRQGKGIPRLPDPHVGLENIKEDSKPDPERLMDWHNWTQVQMEGERVGPGEQGKPVQVTAEEERKHSDLFRSNGFSGWASDKISVHRAIPDIRNKGCKTKQYHASLPTVSVVVPFFNEHWSTLLRTFHSVLDRSPPSLLKEIILVDDASNKPEVGLKLDEYLVDYPKVSIVRMKERGGLITARLEGAKKATGEVIIFLDSHTEANVNWLPPLLDPISQDYRTAVCPFIDVVDFNNLEYRAQDEGARGAFDWQLYYKRLPLTDEAKKNPTEPFASPVMAGGLFAMSAKFFWELGGYDPGLEIWGGEQYELSFKIWQCGGTMVDAPCSRVGHIYRKYSPFGGSGRGDYLGRNYKRVAAVWMDEYAEYVYKQRPHYRDLDPGDISQQVALRKKLNCKPFKWFMKEVAFDLVRHYPPEDPADFVSGEIRSGAAAICVDSKFKGNNERIGLAACSKDSPGSSGEQRFSLTWRKDMRPTKRQKVCWDVSAGGDEAPVMLYNCHGQGGNQAWRYDQENQWLVHGGNPRCLDANPATKELFVSKCDRASLTQRWKIENIDLKQLKKWDDPTKDLLL